MLLAWACVASLAAGRLCWRGVTHRIVRGPFAHPVRIDVNRAPVADLTALPGIGRTLAAAIVLHRVRHGAFRDLEDLEEVDGIGAKTAARLEGLVLLETSDR